MIVRVFVIVSSTGVVPGLTATCTAPVAGDCNCTIGLTAAFSSQDVAKRDGLNSVAHNVDNTV